MLECQKLEELRNLIQSEGHQIKEHYKTFMSYQRYHWKIMYILKPIIISHDDIQVEETPTKIQVQNLQMASWILNEKQQFVKLNIGTRQIHNTSRLMHN